jgi:predicted nucleotidyltransferase
VAAPAEKYLSGWDERARARESTARALLDRVASSGQALRVVLRRYGVAEAWIFGSLARGRPRPESDVDIAVSGCAPAAFYRLAAELERALGLPLDLLDLDRAPLDIAGAIRSEGQRLLP